MAARTPLVVFGALVALGGAVALVLPLLPRSHPRPPGSQSVTVPEGALPAPREPTAEELAWIAPLAPGVELSGWTVDRVEGVQDGAITIALHQGESHVRLQVAQASPTAPLPPVQTGHYAIYFGETQDASQGRALAEALRGIIESHADIPAPDGLGPLPAIVAGH